MGAKLASAWATKATSDSRCAGASETNAGLSEDAWQPHCVKLPDSFWGCALFFAAGAIEHPTAQHLRDFAFS